jgi:membrane associated rhomboid family serine protease
MGGGAMRSTLIWNAAPYPESDMFILPVGDINPRERVPVVNYALIAANLAAFALLATRGDYDRIVSAYGLVPADAGRAPGTFLTSMFLHGGVAHLLGNLLFLWITGDNVEDRFGHLGYLALYLAAGIGAGVAHAITTPPEQAGVPCIGASGAISGVLGAYLLLFPRKRVRVLLGWSVISVPAVLAVGLWFVFQLVSGLGYLGGMSSGGGVAYAAHVGGFVVGLATVKLWAAGRGPTGRGAGGRGAAPRAPDRARFY